MQSIVIIALTHSACNYSASMLCTVGSMEISGYFNSTSSIPLICISKPHLGHCLSTRLANHTRALTHMYKNDSYCYFTRLYSVVINNSISVL